MSHDESKHTFKKKLKTGSILYLSIKYSIASESVVVSPNSNSIIQPRHQPKPSIIHKPRQKPQNVHRMHDKTHQHPGHKDKHEQGFGVEARVAVPEPL